ncbi:MAG: dihydropteroate synthase [Flavipsychrobacter sp.]
MSFKNTLLPIQTTLQSKGRLLDLAQPVVMGILNATPDSFYNKGKDSDKDSLLKIAEKMIRDGAAILDIGGATTKPGASLISPQEELDRVIPAIEIIHKSFPDVWLSADTYNAVVAKEAVAAGVSIINDVSAGRFDANMLQTVAGLKVPYIAMHMQGTPETMQLDPQYGDVVAEVRSYLQNVCDQCYNAGITDVIIDPGFGFGKTLQHNFSLLNELHTFRILGKPVLAGISRKSMICKALKVNPDHALNGTTALHMAALQQGASILRAHDVKEAMEVIALFSHF